MCIRDRIKTTFLSHHTVVWLGYLVYCAFVILCHFVCRPTVTDFSAAEKERSVKVCMHVGLLSGQVFSLFGEPWLSGSHGGGGITFEMNGSGGSTASEHGTRIRNWGRRRRLRPYGGICVLEAC